jgi:uncharacterized protein (TIGR02599 family)
MCRRRSSGFTLVEIMVSTALVVAIMILMLGVVNQTQRLTERSRSKTTQFQSARNAFDSMARRLSQATLNTYWRAQELTIGAEKADYLFRRNSELQFISAPTTRIFTGTPQIANLNEPLEENYPTHCMFFGAPIGFTERVVTGQNYMQFRNLNSMLSAIGYFIEFGDDLDRPDFLRTLQPPYPARLRYRLMEMIVPGEKFNIYYRPKNDDAEYYADPRIFDESGNYYQGLVNVGRRPIDPFIRPYWMKEALKRVSVEGQHRFAYARPMAENVIALIILPKVAEKDRRDPNTSPPSPNVNALELAPSYEFDSWRVLSGGSEPDPSEKPKTGVVFDNRTRDNLLPPIVQLTMIAIDEPSAIRMNLGLTGKPNWTSKYFQKAERVEQYEDDISNLEKDIKKDPKYSNVNYRIFTTDVIIRGSKWSRDPKQKY